MLYHIVKPLVRIGLFFFFRKIYFNTKHYFGAKGPLLLAVNHPNSFLDAVVIGSFFKQPVYFLARGDAFKKKWALRVLTALKCKPVYRLLEGKEYLHLNDATFDACKQVFQKNGIVLIFTEGLCKNEWEIRPLKKGTARLAFGYWKQFGHINNLKVLPVGISYSSYRKMPKNCWVNFGKYIESSRFDLSATDGENYAKLNALIVDQWKPNILTLTDANSEAKAAFELYLTTANAPYEAVVKKTETKKGMKLGCWLYTLLSLPAYVLVYPWYKWIYSFVMRKAGGSVHFDSILFAVLTLGFTGYMLLLSAVFWYFCPFLWLFILIICLLCSSVVILTKFRLSCRRNNRLVVVLQNKDN